MVRCHEFGLAAPQVTSGQVVSLARGIVTVPVMLNTPRATATGSVQVDGVETESLAVRP